MNKSRREAERWNRDKAAILDNHKRPGSFYSTRLGPVRVTNMDATVKKIQWDLLTEMILSVNMNKTHHVAERLNVND